LAQTLSEVCAAGAGFVADGRIIDDMSPNPQSVRNGEQTIAWTRTVFDELRALPGVSSVGSTAAFPLRGTLDGSVFVQFQGEGFDPARPQGARQRLVSAGCFEAMGVPLD